MKNPAKKNKTISLIFNVQAQLSDDQKRARIAREISSIFENRHIDDIVRGITNIIESSDMKAAAKKKAVKEWQGEEMLLLMLVLKNASKKEITLFLKEFSSEKTEDIYKMLQQSGALKDLRHITKDDALYDQLNTSLVSFTEEIADKIKSEVRAQPTGFGIRLNPGSRNP